MAASSGNIDDYHWLVSPEALPFLERAADTCNSSLVKTTLSLRKELGPSRTHLVIAQSELRKRAKVKFSGAERMFFTRQLLEQATDEQIASHKAARFPSGEGVADMCCGIGGDLLGLAARGPVQGFDRDAVAVLLAKANCRALGIEDASISEADVTGLGVGEFGAWHLDPDRRAEGKRTIRVENHDPGTETIEQFLRENRKAAIKLAPGTKIPEAWAKSAEVEWIGNRGECRQQMVWFDELARCPGERAATVFAPGASSPYTIRGLPIKDLPVSPALRRYVYEPHAAVLASHLTGILSERYNLPCVSPKIPYFTSDTLVSDPALACFEVEEVLPVDPKYLRAAVRDRKIGTLEVKKRGVRIDPDEVRRLINPRGEESATLIIVPVNKKVSGLLTRRVVDAGG